MIFTTLRRKSKVSITMVAIGFLMFTSLAGFSHGDVTIPGNQGGQLYDTFSTCTLGGTPNPNLWITQNSADIARHLQTRRILEHLQSLRKPDLRIQLWYSVHRRNREPNSIRPHTPHWRSHVRGSCYEHSES